MSRILSTTNVTYKPAMNPTLQNQVPASTTSPYLLALALRRNQEIQGKLGACATELSTINEALKEEFVSNRLSGIPHQIIAHSENVKHRIRECTGELNEVSQILTKEMVGREQLNNKLIETRRILSGTKNILSNMQRVLSISLGEVEKAQLRALHDYNTGIPNRQLFYDRLQQSMALAKRCDWTLAVMFIDLDRFKLINDNFGHATGDEVLKTVAQRLNEQVRSEDTICRYGGDEFLYLLVNPGGIADIQRIAKKVHTSIAKTMNIGELTLSVESSIGIAVYPDDGMTVEELISNADTAMYHAKSQKTGHAFFDMLDGRYINAGNETI